MRQGDRIIGVECDGSPRSGCYFRDFCSYFAVISKSPWIPPFQAQRLTRPTVEYLGPHLHHCPPSHHFHWASGLRYSKNSRSWDKCKVSYLPTHGIRLECERTRSHLAPSTQFENTHSNTAQTRSTALPFLSIFSTYLRRDPRFFSKLSSFNLNFL